MIFGYFTMRPIPYYKITKDHEKICLSNEPCSFHELLFYVEAPREMTGLDIMQYVQYFDIKDYGNLIKDVKQNSFHGLILRDSDLKNYNWYDLFSYLSEGFFKIPVIVSKEKDRYFLVEGRHRMKLLNLMYLSKIEEYVEITKKIPAIIVEHVGDFPMKQPEGYGKFESWLAEHSFNKKANKRKEIFATWTEDYFRA